jgi:(2R)-ethylmalonyl-CoA mutase
MKAALVDSHRERIRRIESGEQTLVGVNKYGETEPSPLTADAEGGILVVDPDVAGHQRAALAAWRAARDQAVVDAALDALRSAAAGDANIMPPSIAAAKAGVTTGEWGEALRRVFGEYRAPTGVSTDTASPGATEEIRFMVAELAERIGETPRVVVGKPGLDGHSNGAEQIALRARDVGMEVAYDGIRQTPAEIVAKARETKAHVVGLSILSGSHVPLVRDVKARLRREGLDHVPVVVGGIISAEDELVLKNIGVAAVYTPKDYALDAIMADMVRVVARAWPHEPDEDSPARESGARRRVSAG